MGYGDDGESVGDQIKKHLDKAEQRINAKFNHMIEQMSGQATENNVLMGQNVAHSAMIRFGVADRMVLARDIALLTNELEVLELFLASKFPELKVLFQDRAREREEHAKDQ